MFFQTIAFGNLIVPTKLTPYNLITHTLSEYMIHVYLIPYYLYIYIYLKVRLYTPQVGIREHVNPKIRNSESGHWKLLLQNKNGTLISFWGTRTTCSPAARSQFPLIQASLWRAQMFGGSFGESSQKSKTNSTAKSRKGVHSLEWCSQIKPTRGPRANHL